MESMQPTETQNPIRTDLPGSLSKPSSSTEQIWSEYVEPVWDSVMSYLANVPDYIGSFFSGYKKPLIVLGAILASFVTVKVTLAVLDAIDDIPLLAPILQLVGIVYTGWRYLLKDENRRELLAEIDALKAQVFGSHNNTL
ncbi:MAG: CAAD domain-containing protein [Microcystis sp. 53602_E8]|nr:CAAD domain-containing protein [Microcystis sp. 53602_E8]